MYPWAEFEQQVSERLQAALTLTGLQCPKKVEETLEEPPDPKLGDLCSNICFELAKIAKQNPDSLSHLLLAKMQPGGMIAKIEAVRGYLNFFVNLPLLAEKTFACLERMKEKYGSLEKRGKVIVEHTSVNPTKPLHVGHGRNAVLGDTMARILRKLGYRVEVHNYIDDLGLQVAEILTALEKIELPRTKFDHALGLVYVKFQEFLKKHPEVEEEVRKKLKALERGEKSIYKTARRIAEACVRANLSTAEKLGIRYDLLVWESDLVQRGVLSEALDLLRKSGRLMEENGATLLRLEDFGLENKVLIRSDGTTVYLARDIAYQLWKFGKTKSKLLFKPWLSVYTTHPQGRPSTRFGKAWRVINVIGAEQKDAQRSVFTALKALGYEQEYQNSLHLAYEHVWLPTGRFSGREGTWVGHSLDEAIEEAVARAREIIEKREPEASGRFKEKIARIVGLGALRFSLVSTSPEKKIVFKWEEALNFEKNSGPAIQYSHARACSILKKAKVGHKTPDWSKLQLEEEKELVKLIAKYPKVLRLAGEELRPNLLANYAAKLSSLFNSFYEKAPVLKAEKGLREARVKLVEGIRFILADALGLLGIEAPERI
jgi:arginyl-tRNA synthetase